MDFVDVFSFAFWIVQFIMRVYQIVYFSDRKHNEPMKTESVQLNDIEQGESRWRTFADPEGNEFDLVATPA